MEPFRVMGYRIKCTNNNTGRVTYHVNKNVWIDKPSFLHESKEEVEEAMKKYCTHKDFCTYEIEEEVIMTIEPHMNRLFDLIMSDPEIREHYKDISRNPFTIELELKDKYISIENQWSTSLDKFYIFVDDYNLDNQKELLTIKDVTTYQVLDLLAKLY